MGGCKVYIATFSQTSPELFSKNASVAVKTLHRVIHRSGGLPAACAAGSGAATCLVAKIAQGGGKEGAGLFALG